MTYHEYCKYLVEDLLYPERINDNFISFCVEVKTVTRMLNKLNIRDNDKQ